LAAVYFYRKVNVKAAFNLAIKQGLVGLAENNSANAFCCTRYKHDVLSLSWEIIFKSARMWF
jgi:hypothetical protein